MTERWVEIQFDCAPLRGVGRLDAPIDASPDYRALCERVKAAIEKHGSHNTYYLYNADCKFHLANSPAVGLIDFKFEGVVMTDPADTRTVGCDLNVQLLRETCDWLTEPIVRWFQETVLHAVAIEFDRFIQAGDLEQAKRRLEQLQSASDAVGGYVGFYL
jgi:hypothetical protein